MARVKSAPSMIGTLPSALGFAPQSGRASSNRNKLYGRKWRKYRVGFLTINRYCVFCKARGERTRATVVDHIDPHNGDEQKFWDPDNHQALCDHDHSSTKQQFERSQGI